ncbi:MAG: hypothetical protein ACMXYC_04475 [Candidatus Woesearchaeota archaeon]
MKGSGCLVGLLMLGVGFYGGYSCQLQQSYRVKRTFQGYVLQTPTQQLPIEGEQVGSLDYRVRGILQANPKELEDVLQRIKAER